MDYYDEIDGYLMQIHQLEDDLDKAYAHINRLEEIINKMENDR